MILSCQQKENKAEQTAIDPIEEQTEEQHIVSKVDGLYLNDGEAWLINEEMKPFVLNAKEILDGYNLIDSHQDYVSIALGLKEQNQLLINSCTMQGESHDVLHEWLVPHLELTKALEEAENKELADSLAEQLKESFASFNIYFK